MAQGVCHASALALDAFACAQEEHAFLQVFVMKNEGFAEEIVLSFDMNEFITDGRSVHEHGQEPFGEKIHQRKIDKLML